MMKTPNVIAVVVTFNRFQLLKKTISCLRATPGLGGIIVVNNASTDGTREWLDGQPDLHVVHQENVGGSGGFHTGMRCAYDAGADMIWCMDDDVFPRPDCLERLLSHSDSPDAGIMVPRRMVEGQIFSTEFKRFDLSRLFGSLGEEPLRKMTVDVPIEISGATFEGILISRRTVDRIGLPEKGLFIFYDDTDYCLRTLQAGLKIVYVSDAVMDKYLFFKKQTWVERTRAKRWKRFYQVRNSAWFNHRYGSNWSVRNLRAFNTMLGYFFPALLLGPFTKAYKTADAWRFVKAFLMGRKERLGKIDFI